MAKSQARITKQKANVIRMGKKAADKTMKEVAEKGGSNLAKRVSEVAENKFKSQSAQAAIKRKEGFLHQGSTGKRIQALGEIRETKKAKSTARKAAMRTLTGIRARGKDESSLSRKAIKRLVEVNKRVGNALQTFGKGFGKLSGVMAPKVNPVGLRKKQAQKKGGS